MSELRVRVAAYKDATFDALFRDLKASSRDANRVLVEQSKQAHSAQMTLLKHKFDQDKANFRALLSETKSVNDQRRKIEIANNAARLKDSAAMLKHEQQLELSTARETAKQKSAIELSAARESSRQQRDVAAQGAREAERAMRSARGRSEYGRDMGYRMGYWASRNLSPITPMMSYAGRMGHDLLRGAGIDFNFGNIVGQRVHNEALATKLSSSGYLPMLEGPNAQRVAPKALLNEAGQIAGETGMSASSILEGMRGFVGITGDLDMGRKMIKDIAVMSKASGSAFEDMIQAAGEISAKLGDIPEKEAKIKDIMKAIAGQGHMGAIEIRQMAVQMASLAGAAKQFGGDAGTNMALMGALAQTARQLGGAKSPAQAATSVMSFMNTFSKGARVKEFKAAGIEVFDKDGKIRNPEQIILEALQKTGGDNLKMGKLFADVRARTVTRGFENIYKQAGGGQAGLDAVHKEFQKYAHGAMTDKQVAESFALAMQTAESRAQQFQNQINKVGNEMADKMLPQLEKLGPKAIELTQAFGGMATYLASNPFAIIPTLLGAALAKAGLENAIRVGVENTTRGALGQLGGGFGGGAGVAGNALAGLVIASAAVAMFTVGKMYVDSMFEQKAKQTNEQIAGTLGSEGAKLQREIESGSVSNEGIDATKKKIADNERVIAEGRKKQGEWNVTESMFRGFARLTGSGATVDKEMTAETLRINALIEENIKLRETLIHGISVKVDNLPGAGWQGPPTPTPAASAPEPHP